MLFLKSHDTVSTKIEKFIALLKDQVQPGLSEERLKAVREELNSFFKQYSVNSGSSKKKQKKNKVKHIEDEIPTEENRPLKPSVEVKFQEYTTKTYESANFNPFTLLRFEPISGFLAKREGIEEKNTGEEQSEEVS